jgi:tetratricopeptide (TPR) repeat protein
VAIFRSLFRNLHERLSGRRNWTAAEVRRLVDSGQLGQAAEAVKTLVGDTPQKRVDALCLAGEVALRSNDEAKALEDFREALKLAPGSADAHYGLSLVLLARGQKESALRHAQFSVNGGLTQSRFHAQLGLCQLELGNYARAERALAQATRLAPEDKSSWNHLGIASRARGNLRRSAAAFRRALQISPTYEQAKVNLARLEEEAASAGTSLSVTPAQPQGEQASPQDARLAHLHELASSDRLQEAVDLCESLCMNEPGIGRWVVELSRAYRSLGDPQSGLDALEAFLARCPDDMEVIAELGTSLVRESEFKRAKPHVARALEAQPDHVGLLLAMAEIREQQLRFADAGALIERACALAPSIHLKGKLAASLINRCHYDEAIRLLDEMVEEDPSAAPDVASLKAHALTHAGRHDEALPLLDDLIRQHPHDPKQRFPRATIHLLNERYAQGWDDYVYRNLSSTKHLRMLPFPQWQGQSLMGKSIVVLAEQGLGDQVMFASCLPDLLELGPARVVVEAIKRVAPTLARSFPACEVIATKQDNALEWVRKLDAIDYFVPIADLPQRFRRSREAFPAHQGYLKPDPVRRTHWQNKLASGGARMKVGLSWRGGTEQTRTSLRSLPIEALATALHGIEADWVCLQYGNVDADVLAANAAGHPMLYWREAIADLDEFAALTSALDLVITVCNTTVHYAGAQGVPVWVMAPKVPEWRYGLRSASLPWYPSSVMYRQDTAGEWAAVLARVREDLDRVTSGGRPMSNGATSLVSQPLVPAPRR